MSKATKVFDKVTTLKEDGSNWLTWETRVERAASSLGYDKYLTTAGTGDEEKEDKDLLNGIIGALPDKIFRRYKSKKTSKELWDALKTDFDAKNPLTQAYLEGKLFGLRCHNPAKINEHLDTLVEIQDELSN